jgi:CRISPR-associated endoribonuclease Cas6
MESPLSHFKFAQFQFVLRAEDCINLPAYKGSTLRGAFGHAFKKILCVNRERACESCLLKGKCVYSYVFETPPPSDATRMRKYPFAPHPFIITPPLEEKRTYPEGETLTFELTLIGRAIDYLPYFIYTFDELSRIGIGKGKGKYHLEEVRAIQADEGSQVRDEKAILIYSGKDKILRNNFGVLKVDDLDPLDLSSSTLHLIFMTPTRLKFDGKLSPTLEFHILIRNLLRRISLLYYFHCGEELNLNFKGLIEEAKGVKVQQENLQWFDWERYSNRQETRMMMGGFIGSIVFQGNFEPFMPFLMLGEHIHVGKGTSFGLGKYKVEEPKSGLKGKTGLSPARHSV